MTKKITTISILLISTILISLYVVSSTYAVIINIITKDNTSEIVNEITINDVLRDDNGNYNSYYYDVKRELNITKEEEDSLIESVPLNNLLKTILSDVVNYRIHNKNRLTDEEIYNLIVNAVNSDDNIEEEVKEKVIAKSSMYIKDVTDYIYGITIKNVNN